LFSQTLRQFGIGRFAIRTGLIEKQRLFSNDQLLNIYQSINNTFESGCNLIQEDEKSLSSIHDQIEGILLDVKEWIAAIQQKDFDAIQEQSM